MQKAVLRTTKGVGGEEKSLTPPHIFLIWGSGKPNLLSSWGFRQGLPSCQNIRAYPLLGLPPKFETVSKNFWGVVPLNGVFEGVDLIRMSHKFFWAFKTKKTPGNSFHFCEFRPRGWAMPPQKMVKFLTFLKNSRKIEGAKYMGAPWTRSISVVGPTLRWGRFSPHPPNFLGNKTIFQNFGHFGAPYRKTLRCIRTKLSGFVDMWEVNKIP